MAECKQCGKAVEDAAVYCSFCGAALCQLATAAPQGLTGEKVSQAVSGFWGDFKEAVTDIAGGVLSPSPPDGQQNSTPSSQPVPQPEPAEAAPSFSGDASFNGGAPAPEAPPHYSQQAYENAAPLQGQGYYQAPPQGQGYGNPPQGQGYYQASPQGQGYAYHPQNQSYPYSPQPSAYGYPQQGYYSPPQAVDNSGYGLRAVGGQQITTPDGRTETVLKQSIGHRATEIKFTTDGTLMLTPTRLLWYKQTTAKWLLMGSFRHLTQGEFDFEIPLYAIHSIEVEKFLGGAYYTIHTYCGRPESFQFTRGIQENWVDVIHMAAPDLPSCLRKTREVYRSNISPNDPRNPWGSCYNPGYPRHREMLRVQDPTTFGPAVEDAIRAGLLPAGWQLPEGDRFNLNAIPLGIPYAYSAFDASVYQG